MASSTPYLGADRLPTQGYRNPFEAQVDHIPHQQRDTLGWLGSPTSSGIPKKLLSKYFWPLSHASLVHFGSSPTSGQESKPRSHPKELQMNSNRAPELCPLWA